MYHQGVKYKRKEQKPKPSSFKKTEKSKKRNSESTEKSEPKRRKHDIEQMVTALNYVGTN